jgi:kinesin family protein 5
MASDNNIKVLCRFRPQNKRELAEGGEIFTEFDKEFTSVYSKSKDYPGNCKLIDYLTTLVTFDKCFDWNTSQADLFSYASIATITGASASFPNNP